MTHAKCVEYPAWGTGQVIISILLSFFSNDIPDWGNRKLSQEKRKNCSMVSLSPKIHRGTVLRLEIILVNFSSRDSSTTLMKLFRKQNFLTTSSNKHLLLYLIKCVWGSIRVGHEDSPDCPTAWSCNRRRWQYAQFFLLIPTRIIGWNRVF